MKEQFSQRSSLMWRPDSHSALVSRIHSLLVWFFVRFDDIKRNISRSNLQIDANQWHYTDAFWLVLRKPTTQHTFWDLQDDTNSIHSFKNNISYPPLHSGHNKENCLFALFTQYMIYMKPSCVTSRDHQSWTCMTWGCKKKASNIL